MDNMDNNDKLKTASAQIYDALKNEEISIFGNFFGVVSNKYIKYFNLLALHLISTLVFATIYYFLLKRFDKHFFIQQGFSRKQMLNYTFLTACIVSINFQTTVAYVDLKCKSLFSRLVTVIQTLTTFLITFLFLI
jgi:hypothetical protein